MDLVKLLTMAGVKLPDLKKALEIARANAPDLAPQIDALLAKLDVKLDESAILDLAAGLLPELTNLVRGRIESKPHAGDAA